MFSRAAGPEELQFVPADAAVVLLGEAATPDQLAALRHRDRTGEGQYIDLSQAEASLRAVQEELDNLANQMGQLDEDYGAALDRKDQLDAATEAAAQAPSPEGAPPPQDIGSILAAMGGQ